MTGQARGFHVVAIIMAIAVIGVVGALTVAFLNALHKSDQAASMPASSEITTAATIQTIATPADLDAANQELTAMSFDDDAALSSAANF